MAVTNGWGQGAVNNSNGWGKGKANSSDGWGNIYADSEAGDTNIVGGGVLSISYPSAALCENASDPTPTVSNNVGAGTFSSTAGLVFVSTSTGVIDISGSTVGSYIITYTDTDGATTTFNFSINALDNASFSYASSSYTQAESDPTPSITGLAGGTFSAGSGLVFVDSGSNTGSSTGQIDLSASTIQSYTITYTTAGTCPNSSTFGLSVTAAFTNIYSVEFDGVNDNVDTSYVMSGTTWTISYWAKIQNAGNWAYHFSQRDSSVDGLAVWGKNTDNRIITVKLNGTADTDAFTVSSYGAWNHICFTSDGTTLTSYLNGSSVSTKNISASPTISTTNTAKLGKQQLSNLYFYEGNMDEWAFWDSCLTASNVSTIYNSGTPNDISSLSPISWYRFETGSGTTAVDSGSGGNNGTLVNGTAYSTSVPT